MSSSLSSPDALSILEYLAGRGECIEKELEKLLSDADSRYPQLTLAARYSLLGGGKRIRPILTIATAELFGYPLRQSLRIACALELVHTYSLIHDDLPCMDDDDFRRGKPSLHKAFSEAHAVLTGDFLLTYAFEIIAEDEYLNDSQKIELVRLLAKGAGGQGMIAGQIMDIENEGKAIEIEELEFIHRCKTGALLVTAVLSGAVIGNATIQEKIILKAYGEDIGLAFQIVDDILDVTGSLKKKDSHYSSDIKNNKTTYVSLLGLDGAKDKAHSLLESAVSHLERTPYKIVYLKQLAELIINRLN